MTFFPLMFRVCKGGGRKEEGKEGGMETGERERKRGGGGKERETSNSRSFSPQTNNTTTEQHQPG